jgi:hypothetical protein
VEILGQATSEKFNNIFQAATDIAAIQGKSISFRPAREHPNPIFRNTRGVKATVLEYPDILGIYLNETLGEPEFELVAVHELCHVVADYRGFGYRYGLTNKIPRQQLDLWEEVAVCIGQCFTHLAVYRLVEEYGYSIHGFDNYLLDEIGAVISQQRKPRTVAIAKNAVLHLSHVFQDKHSLSTLDLGELESILDGWDRQILELSRAAQPAIPDVNLFTATGCFKATVALRNAIGTELAINLAACIDYFNPQTGLAE